MKRLAEMAFTEVEPLAKNGNAIVILPVGVVEEHGAHLPLGLDSFAAEVYTASAAPHLEDAGYEVVVAPTINYGVARAAIDFPGTLSVRAGDITLGGDRHRPLLRPPRADSAGRLNGHRDLHHMKALDEATNDPSEEKRRQVLWSALPAIAAVTDASYRDGAKQFYQSPRPTARATAASRRRRWR